MRISDWSSDVCSSDLAHNHSRAATIEHPARLAARSQSRRTCTAPTGDFPMKAVLLAATILVGANSAHAQVSAPQHANPTPSPRSEEHTSELQSLMRISYAVFCLKKKKSITSSTSSNSITSILDIHID